MDCNLSFGFLDIAVKFYAYFVRSYMRSTPNIITGNSRTEVDYVKN